jgi:hypothetical protein
MSEAGLIILPSTKYKRGFEDEKEFSVTRIIQYDSPRLPCYSFIWIIDYRFAISRLCTPGGKQ